MKYINKKTNKIVEPKTYTEKFMCQNNSNYEEYQEKIIEKPNKNEFEVESKGISYENKRQKK